MQQDTGLSAVAHVISLAIAPVFLLSAIGAILNVLISRLGRVVDRARLLEARAESMRTMLPDDDAELHMLARRATLINRSVTLCTITALLICTVVALLFLGSFLRFNASIAVAALFVAAMLTFFASLVIFLGEIFAATKSVRIGINHVMPRDKRWSAATRD
jgi:Protein of unknown function (DUF2721)